MEDRFTLALMVCFNFGVCNRDDQFASEEMQFLAKLNSIDCNKREQVHDSQRPEWVPPKTWNSLCQMQDWPFVKEITSSLCGDMDSVWQTWLKNPEVSQLARDFPVPSLPASQKLLVVSLLRPDGMLTVAKQFVAKILGNHDIEFEAVDVNSLLVNLAKKELECPVLLLLSEGSDTHCISSVAEHLSQLAKVQGQQSVVIVRSCCSIYNWS